MKSKTNRTIIWGRAATTEAVALSYGGVEIKTICEQTGLTPGQVSYALQQDAKIEGLPKDANNRTIGHARTYRKGKGAWFHLMMQKVFPAAVKSVRTNVIPKAIKPPPEVAPNNNNETD